MIPYIISQNGTISASVDGKNYSFDKSSQAYNHIKKAVNSQDKKLFLQWVDFDKEFRSKSSGKVTFENGVIRYNGSKVDNALSRRIVQLYTEGFDFKPLIKFMENCYQNPNPTVIDSLYKFMENNCIMLDADGYIVGYKKVRDDGYDFYSGTVLYEVGKTVSQDMSKCSLDTTQECAPGLYVGSRNYAENLWHKGRGKILLLRVHPKNILCVPETSEMEKLRACEVEVIEEYKVGNQYKYVYTPEYQQRDASGRFIAGSKVISRRDSNGRFIKKS